jgi:hypothetical protein
MDVKGKTKDNIKTIMNITLFCHHKNIKLVYVRSRVTKPKANFALDNNAHLLVYQYLKSLCFPDKYASNISRLMNLKDYRLYEMRSHDCHILCKHLFH